MKRLIQVIAGLLLAAGAAWAQEAGPDFRNPDCAVDERVTDLINRMTLEEKAAWMETEPPPIERLGVPGYSWWSEGIHGVGRAGRATMFPEAIALAATWDVSLMTQVATVIGDEARLKHKEAPEARYHGLSYWAPSADLARDPRWGRIEETYGEDPYLTTQMALAYIKALQGDDPTYLKIAATPKHFAAHGQETGRHALMVDVSERVLREYYLYPFRASFVEGQAASCMSAYNGVAGWPCTANRWLLTDLLRGEWGFEGVIVTDWGAPRCLRTSFKLVTGDEYGVALALTAGVNVLCQYDCMYDNILAAVQCGLVAETQLDEALRRSLKLLFRLGLFDPPERVPYTQIPPAWLGRPAHVALAREASRESIVLLKNEPVPGAADPTPILPLDRRRLESIAVVGPHANRAYLGAYSGEPAEPAVTTLRGINNHLSDRVIVRHVPWVELDDEKRKDKTADAKQQAHQKQSIEDAVKAAAASDIALVVLGLSDKIEREGQDRVDIDLPKNQQEFIEKIVAVNPATVVVLINGSPLAIHWIQQHVPAVVEAWYAGEQGGTAIADVLFGDYNPAGRLPLTFYAALAQLPPLDDYDIGLGRTYLYLKDPPLYPFGHGLSFTRFEYGNLRFDRETVDRAGTVHVTVDVTNAGDRDGDEVGQLYVRAVNAPVPVPIKQLRGFQRVHIPRGETRTLRFAVAAADLGYWDETHRRWRVAPGVYEVQVGASSSDIRLQHTFRVAPNDP